MNANELADALDWVCENHLVGIGDADFKATATMLRQQAGLIRNLQKSLGFKNNGYETINLTPQLELTDEEIRKIALDCDAYENDGGLITDDICIDKFARAILRKAQEK